MTDLSLRERLADYGVSGDEMDAGGVVDLIVAWLSDNGLAIVPVDSTPQMYAKGAVVTNWGGDAESVYDAMVKAAPPAADLLKGKTNDQG